MEISCTRCDRAHSSKSRPRKRPRLDSCSNASSATLHSHFWLCNLAYCSYFATFLPFCPSVLVLHQHGNERVDEQLLITNRITFFLFVIIFEVIISNSGMIESRQNHSYAAKSKIQIPPPQLPGSQEHNLFLRKLMPL